MTILTRRRRRARRSRAAGAAGEQGADRRGDPRRRRTACDRAAKIAAMESVYDLYQRGCELLEHGDHEAAIVPLQQGARSGARQGLDPRGAGPRAVPRPALRAAPPTEFEAVAAQRADERLRAVLPRAARCSCWDAIARPASRWRWRARCGPSATTTGCTATARAATPSGA